MGFDKGYVLSTGANVRAYDSPKKGGDICIHFVNPLIGPHDLPTIVEKNDEMGRHTATRLSRDAAEALYLLLGEWLRLRQ